MIRILYLCWQQSTNCLANLNKILEGKFCFNENQHQYKLALHLIFLTLINFSQLNASYTFANKYEAEKDENNDVPQILHFLWVFQPIPEKYLEAISAFEKNNPNYEVRV